MSNRYRFLWAAPVVIAAVWVVVGATALRPSLVAQPELQEPPIVLDVGPQLFIDDFLVQSSENVTRVVSQPRRTLPGPIVTSDLGFQSAQNSVNVLRNPGTGRFRMWYNASRTESEEAVTYFGPSLAYRESDDGVIWNGPLQRLALEHTYDAGVIDEGPDFQPAEERFKLVYMLSLKKPYSDPEYVKTRIAFSPDGLNWTWYSTVDTLFPGHGSSSLRNWGDILHSYYDPIRQQYGLFFRLYEPYTWMNAEGITQTVSIRRTGFTTSQDFKQWSEPVVIFSPDDKDSGVTQWYGGPASVQRRGDLLIGMVKELRDDAVVSGAPEGAFGMGYTVLAWTRDGVNWQRDRYTDPFFLPDPTAGAWDHAHAWIDSILPVGDELYLYYGGYRWGHKYKPTLDRQLGLVKLPRDRYVARKAYCEVGKLWTPPVVLNAGDMALNLDTTHGWIDLRVLDTLGSELTRCERLSGINQLDAKVVCEQPLSTFLGQPIQLEFSMQNASLYALYMEQETAPDTPTPPAGSTPLPSEPADCQPPATATPAFVTVTPTATPTPTPTPLPLTTFADGFESGDLAAWPAASTGGGDLAVSPAAALEGNHGLQAVVDDSVGMYVQDNSPDRATDYQASFRFDPNSIAMASGDTHNIFVGRSSDADVFRLALRRYNSAYQLALQGLTDASVFAATSWYSISDAPHTVQIDWRAATAAGSNDGAFSLWIDGVLKQTRAGIDNDTLVVDEVRLGSISSIDAGTRGVYFFDGFASRGKTESISSPTSTSTATPASAGTPTGTPAATATWTPLPTMAASATSTPSPTPTPMPPAGLIFVDDFESGDISVWSASVTGGGDLSVQAAAALEGSRGLQAVIDDNAGIFVEDDHPFAERRYRASFRFDPNSIAMTSGDTHNIFVGRSSGIDVFRLAFRRYGSSYQLALQSLTDAAVFASTSWYTLSDAPHVVAIETNAATTAGANDGAFSLWIDGVLRQTRIGIDSDTVRVDEVRLGPVSSIDSGTRGAYFFDDFEAGLAGGGTATPATTPTSISVQTETATATPAQSPTVTPTPTPMPPAGPIFVDDFESGDISVWSASVTGGGDLSVQAAAALEGSRGLQAVIDDNAGIFVEDDHPFAERRYRASFRFDPNSIAMTSGDTHNIFVGRSSGIDVFRLAFRRYGSSYQLALQSLTDAAVFASTSWYTLSDAPHVVAIETNAATTAGANDGAFSLWIDGVLRQTRIGIDSDTVRVDEVRLGPVSSIDSGTRGVYYFDGFASER